MIKGKLRTLWWLLATLIILAAVIMVLVRVALPRVGAYRAEIQEMASSVFRQPVKIEDIEATWHGWTPELRLSGVSLLDPNGSLVITEFKHASMRIDLFGSMRKWALTPYDLTVSGMELSLLRTQQGRVTVQGMVLKSDPDALPRWLLAQPDLRLEDAQITWYDQKNGAEPQTFRNVSIRIRNQRDRHQINAIALLPGELGERLQFKLNAEGDLLNGPWSGQGYLQGDALKLSSLLPKTIEHTDGALDLRLLGTWKEGELAEINGAFAVGPVEIANTTVEPSTPAIELHKASGRFKTTFEPDGWRVVLDKLHMRTRNGSWPETTMLASVSGQGKGGQKQLAATASFVRIQDLLPLVKYLKDIQVPDFGPIRGDIHDLKVSYLPKRSEGNRLTLNAKFQDVERPATELAIGFGGVAGVIEASETEAKLDLTSKVARVVYPRTADSIPPIRLSGKIIWRKEAETQWIATKRLDLENSDLHLRLNGKVVWSNERPVGDLRARFTAEDINSLSAYVPESVFSKTARTWLATRVSNGKVESGEALFIGPIGSSMDDGGQRLDLAIKVRGATLRYLDDWPQIDAIDADIAYDGKDVVVDIENGDVFGASIRQTRIRIDGQTGGGKQLSVSGQASGDWSQGERFINDSPLRSSLGQRLKDIELLGKTKLDLALEVPLRSGAKPNVSGKLVLSDNHLKGTGFELKNLSGVLTFDQSKRSARGLQANYLGSPVSIDLDLSGNNDGPPPEARIVGHADVKFIQRQLLRVAPDLRERLQKGLLLDKLQGRSRWEATVKFPSSSNATTRLRLTSDLDGLAIKAPAPLGKAAGQRTRLQLATTFGGGTARTIDLRYGDLVHAQLVRTEGSADQGRTIVRLGQDPVRLPNPAPPVWIGGRLPRFDIGEWLSLLNDKSKHRRVVGLPQTTIDLRIDQLDAFGYRLGDTAVKVNNTTNDWIVEVDGKRVSGEIRIPNGARPLVAKLNHLRLSEKSELNVTAAPPDPNRLPALTVRCASLEYNGIDLGQAELETTPDNQGLRMDKLSFSSDVSNISASGQWMMVGNQHSSRIDMKTRADQLGPLLKQFGYDASALEARNARIGITANWSGPPAGFSIDTTAGNLTIQLQKGRISTLEHRVGRLLGLFNIKSLRRRLLLDFGDLFKSGFAFDRIQGNFQIKKGNAYTNDLAILGPSALMQISGRTGLSEKDYDQLITVTPAFGDSFPVAVASALLGPIGAGVDATGLLPKRVFDSVPEQIDEIFRKQYTVTGSWDNPIVKPLEQRSEIANGTE